MYLEYYDEQINDRLILPILKMSYQYFVVSNYNQIMIQKNKFLLIYQVTKWYNNGIN